MRFAILSFTFFSCSTQPHNKNDAESLCFFLEKDCSIFYVDENIKCKNDAASLYNSIEDSLPIYESESLKLNLAVSKKFHDFYRVDVSPNDTLYAGIFFDTSYGDIDIEIINFAGEILKTSESGSNNEFILLKNITDRTLEFYIHIYPWGNTFECNTYDLVIYID